jgi:class 3 adenylate cyclase/predicted ATPase
MTFDEILAQVLDLLQRQGRVSYRALKRRFDLDDAYLEDLKVEIIKAQQLAVDEDGEVLVWKQTPASTPSQTESLLHTPVSRTTQIASPAAVSESPRAERRQLTVLFCDLVDSTRLASQLDPEEWREVVRAYQETCATVIQRYEGYIAQYLGDGLLVYFGYPQAHEDDAQRAVRAGLGMVEAMGALNTRLTRDKGLRLAVRLGLHTGLVVVGEMGGGGRQEQLALGEAPNVAARVQGLAAPDTVVISTATYRLVQGFFRCHDLGPHPLRGVTTPVQVYHVLGESGVQSRLDVATPTGLTPLVGREEEVNLLQRRWEQARTGMGQVVLLSGESGIGKSRLVQVLQEQVTNGFHARIVWRGSPYHQQSALYPVIEYLHRLLRWRHADPLPEKLRKLEEALALYDLALPEVVPLLTALLSLPVPERYPPLTLTPQRQKQKTMDALLAWLHAEARRQPVLCIVEDLHWIDPSTLELLGLLIDQSSTTRLLMLLTYRPEFRPPWAMQAHLTSLTLSRFASLQVERMATHVAGGKALPAVVLQELVSKTDGVPLFVEELTKTVLESGLLQEQADHYELAGPLPALAIPATLHDALVARLDRLATAKAVAQLGAILGRIFAYELLQAVSPLDEATLQHSLGQLVEAELLSQRGVPPQATYTFKHALIQDAAYQSLLRSTRQQYHREIARVLEARFPETRETQPELVAHHYTEAGLAEQAAGYWQRAGQRAIERSAHVEAISHLCKGLEVLKTLSDTPEHAQQELDLQMSLAHALMAVKGHAAQEMEHAYARAHELCQQLGNPPQVFPVLFGLWRFHNVRAVFTTALDLANQCITLAHQQHDLAHLLVAHMATGHTLFWGGEFTSAHAHLEQALILYTPQQHRSLIVRYGVSPRVQSLFHTAWTLWMLGYPDQALQRGHEAITLAHELAHPFSLAFSLSFAACVLQACREVQAVQERAKAVIALAKEQGFSHWLAHGTIMQGWAQAAQGHGEVGIVQMSQGLTAYQATGARLFVPYFQALVVEACGSVGQAAVGLTVLVEALAAVANIGGYFYEAELHRLKGEFLLFRSAANPIEAEACFQQSLDVAHRQQAKSLELRAAMSLSRLWQRQGKRGEAQQLLAPIYGWFTEGFDTADLQEAKALLDQLA